MVASGSFTIDIVRGGVVESSHVIHAVVTDRSGRAETWGDRLRPTIPRSAIKSVQALPLVATGAADAFEVSVEELALACASHSAEPEHVEAVDRWLARLGLSGSDLECGPDKPLGAEARRQFLQAGAQLSPRYNGCSGKHAGFLTVHRHLGEPVAGYIGQHATVQRLVTAAIETLAGVDLGGQRPGIDGCGIPVFAIPLQNLALAMARLVDPVDLPEAYAEAAPRVVGAAQRAFWVSGTGRTEHQVAEVATEPVLIKGGAEAVFMGALPERGLGIALKAADGSSRASQAAIKALLRRFGAIPQPEDETGEPCFNKAGDRSGELVAVPGAPVPARFDPLEVVAA